MVSKIGCMIIAFVLLINAMLKGVYDKVAQIVQNPNLAQLDGYKN